MAEDEALGSPLEHRVCAADVLSVVPAAIFLPKFENAGTIARENYLSKDCSRERILVAYVKSSGSLWLIAAGAGHVICSSKNGSKTDCVYFAIVQILKSFDAKISTGAGNVYSVAGHYTLLRHFKLEFGEGKWRQMYEDLRFHISRHRLSLGFELVTRCLGEHGSHPRTDHLVLNAVLDRDTLAAYSPLLLLEFQKRYRFQVNQLTPDGGP